MSQQELKRLKALMRKLSSAQEYVFVNKYDQGKKFTEEVLTECKLWKPKNTEILGLIKELQLKADKLLESLKEMLGLLDGDFGALDRQAYQPTVNRRNPDERPIRRAFTNHDTRGGGALPFGKKPFQFHQEKRMEPVPSEPRRNRTHSQDYGYGQGQGYGHGQAHGQGYGHGHRQGHGHPNEKPGWDGNWNNLPGFEQQSPQNRGGYNYGNYNNPPSNVNYMASFDNRNPPPPPAKWETGLRSDNTRGKGVRQRKHSGKPRYQKGKEPDNNKRHYDKPWLKGIKKPKDEKTDIEKKNENFANELSVGQDLLFNRVKGCLLEEEMNVTFDDIIGHTSTKKQFSASIMIMKVQNHIKNELLTPHSGILLYGPPGTGKTMLAKAFAKEKDFKFLSVNPSSIASKYRGDSEQMVSILFQYARSFKNTILFIDEIDGILGSREEKDHEATLRIKNQFLIEIDGISNKKSDGNYLMIVAATNHPWSLDNAAWRRFTSRIYIPLPGKHERVQFIDKFTEKIKLAEGFDKDKLAKNIKGYSGDDIKKMFGKLMMNRFNLLMEKEEFMNMENIENQANEIAEAMNNYQFTNKDFETVLKTTKRSTNEKDIKRYEEFTKVYGEKDN
jgi:ATP-dependent 26S proteasome regulatory subunit